MPVNPITFSYAPIRELREKAEVTLVELHERTGLTYATISRIETATVNVRVAALSVIARELAFDLERHPLGVFSTFFLDSVLDSFEGIYTRAPEASVSDRSVSSIRKEVKRKFRTRPPGASDKPHLGFIITQLQRDYGRSSFTLASLAELTGIRDTRLRSIFAKDSEPTYAILTDMFLPLCAAFAALDQEDIRTYIMRAAQFELLSAGESFEAFLEQHRSHS